MAATGLAAQQHRARYLIKRPPTVLLVKYVIFGLFANRLGDHISAANSRLSSAEIKASSHMFVKSSN